MVNFEHTQIVQISQRMPHSAECYLNYSIQTGNSVPVAWPGSRFTLIR